MRSISPTITTVESITDTTIITPSEVGDWLNLSSAMVAAQTDLITRLIDTAVEVVENYAWIDLRRKTYRADFDLAYTLFTGFLDGYLKLSLERSPILVESDIGTIEYLDDEGEYVTFDKGTLTVDGLYDNVTEKREQRQWASVYFRETVSFDSSRINAYKIRITFDAGFTSGVPSAAVTDIPETLKQALLIIVADMYTNRGDCAGDCKMGAVAVPCSAKGIVDQYAVSRTVLGGSYTPGSDYGWLC